MSDEKQGIISQCHANLEETLGKVISSDAVALYYKYANEFVNSFLRKTTIQDYGIYGVALSGHVQKQLVIPGVSYGYLIFFYHVIQKELDDLEPFQTKYYTILEKIETHIKEIMSIGVKVEILNRSKSSLRIKWKEFEYHIAIAWTFSKRQYCSFHYTEENVHVYQFSPKQLQDAANNLTEEAKTHRIFIENAGKQWKRFFKKNTEASLSLLRVYHMREELIGRNARLAVVYLKLWQRAQMKDRQHLSTNSLEVICTYLSKTRESNAFVPTQEIIKNFFKLMQINKDNKPKIIKSPYLISKLDGIECNSDNILEKKFRWKHLSAACRKSLKISKTTAFEHPLVSLISSELERFDLDSAANSTTCRTPSKENGQQFDFDSAANNTIRRMPSEENGQQFDFDSTANDTTRRTPSKENGQQFDFDSA
ncbi:hypothetical protein RFI_05373, partial [Reticulomyxa filosa]